MNNEGENSKISIHDMIRILKNNDSIKTFSKFELLGLCEMKVTKKIDLEPHYKPLSEYSSVRYYHVFYRKIIRENKIFIEFILNDFTDLKETERINAENKYKEIIFTKIAHEFKTPLIGILYLVSKCLNNKLEINKKHLLQINKISYLLIFMVNDIIDYVNNEEIFSVLPIMFEIDKILDLSYSVLKMLLKHKKKDNRIKVVLDVDPQVKDICIYNDCNRILQMIFNLISNSVKFTQKGFIKIKATCSKYSTNGVRISIEDSGIGISEEKINLIKLNNGMNKDVSQTKGPNILKEGYMGLKNSQQIASHLNTNIEIKSKLGKGSSFSFDVLDFNVKSTRNSLRERTLERMIITPSKKIYSERKINSRFIIKEEDGSKEMNSSSNSDGYETERLSDERPKDERSQKRISIIRVPPTILKENFQDPIDGIIINTAMVNNDSVANFEDHIINSQRSFSNNSFFLNFNLIDKKKRNNNKSGSNNNQYFKRVKPIKKSSNTFNVNENNSRDISWIKNNPGNELKTENLNMKLIMDLNNSSSESYSSNDSRIKSTLKRDSSQHLLNNQINNSLSRKKEKIYQNDDIIISSNMKSSEKLRYSIIIVDDYPFCREILERLINDILAPYKGKYEIIHANDGVEFLYYFHQYIQIHHLQNHRSNIKLLKKIQLVLKLACLQDVKIKSKYFWKKKIL